jgi:hypothetical protein
MKMKEFTINTFSCAIVQHFFRMPGLLITTDYVHKLWNSLHNKWNRSDKHFVSSEDREKINLLFQEAVMMYNKIAPNTAENLTLCQNKLFSIRKTITDAKVCPIIDELSE